jgi:DNA-binding NarL/FixJ family response regulator
MRLLFACDHALVRWGMATLLQTYQPKWEMAEVDCFPDIPRCFDEQMPDLTGIDLTMAGMPNPARLGELCRQYPMARIVILSGTDDPALMMDCLSAGVRGYVLKSAEPTQMLRALEVVLDGGIYFPSALAGAHLSEVSAGAANGAPVKPVTIASLTFRQREVLELLAQGYSTKDIARRLSLGIGTVKAHLAGAYKALGARNRMEAVVKAGYSLCAPSVSSSLL